MLCSFPSLWKFIYLSIFDPLAIKDRCLTIKHVCNLQPFHIKIVTENTWDNNFVQVLQEILKKA
jgi:hypothetical protein